MRHGTGPSGRMSGQGLGCVKTPTFNLRVEIPSRFRKFENQKCLRPLLREDDRENNSALTWLVHVFTQPGSKPEKFNASMCFPLCPQTRTLLDAVGPSHSWPPIGSGTLDLVLAP